MLTFVVVATLLVLAVLGAEMVRATCRRRLSLPLVPSFAPEEPVGAAAVADAD